MSDDNQDQDDRADEGENEEEHGEDEELPFSAEQSDSLTSDHNKIVIRRNEAKRASPSTKKGSPVTLPAGQSKRKANAPSRKAVRRGLEMLVGGVPINADPPQRHIELTYRKDESSAWYNAISLDSRDFGPMYYSPSVDTLNPVQRGLFCEHFVHSTLKWDVCPKDLKALVKGYQALGDRKEDPTLESLMEEVVKGQFFEQMGLPNPNTVEDSSEFLDTFMSAMTNFLPPNQSQDFVIPLTGEDALPKLVELQGAPTEGKNKESKELVETSGRGFGKSSDTRKKPAGSKAKGSSRKKKHVQVAPLLEFEFEFGVDISREDLEYGDSKEGGKSLARVLARAINLLAEPIKFRVHHTKVALTEMEDGSTLVSSVFTLEPSEYMDWKELDKNQRMLNRVLGETVDDGELQLALAASAMQETAWTPEIRSRIAEEFLFQDDDADETSQSDAVVEDNKALLNGGVSRKIGTNDTARRKVEAEDATVNSLKGLSAKDTNEGPSAAPDGAGDSGDDAFVGRGHDCVFWNYSEDSILSAPYNGELGLRLVDSVLETAKTRHPRVIAVGDVHGCIDELQDLLRQCDYRPGDLVVFLGDLVSKGPDSLSVVQMAREIGAIGVRGNHDFEVIRWHQAINSGVDPPVSRSDHYNIASGLSKADVRWMHNLPWYISSKELNALFVHAGFVSGIRLAKQNPRLMMNMRSILPDGTVTSKFFNNWPWARLWDGPSTVLFGHDADRGLQQYEHAIGLDTGCVYGGRLTACILPEKRLVSVAARREYVKYRRKHYD